MSSHLISRWNHKLRYQKFTYTQHQSTESLELTFALSFFHCCSTVSAATYSSGHLLNDDSNPGLILSPFSFPENLEEGMRASVVCSISSGEPPQTIKWYRDNKELKNDNNISIVSITEFVSSLIINKLERSYTGNYTCLASSRSTHGKSVSYTSRMTVRSKPIFMLKPTSQTAIAGNVVRFDCLSEGLPQPVIRWKTSRNNSQSTTILSSPRMHVLENGSLVIRAVEILDEGRYVCEATNGVGKPVETSAELLVYESPVIRASHTQVLVKKRDRAELSCVASGSPHLIFSWMKNDHLLVKDSRGVIITNGNTGISSTHISIHEEDSHNRKEKITILIIHSVTRNDSAVYSCSANNNYGNDRGNIRLIVQESPDPPNDLRFLEVSSRSVSLSWIVAFNGNSPVTGYEVVHKEANGK